MAFLGNIGQTFDDAGALESYNFLTAAVQPTGNGPISNSAPFVADPFAVIVLIAVRSEVITRFAETTPGGIWSFYDLSPGRYFATEAGVSRQWQIDVAADLSFTITPVTSSFPFNASSGYIG